MMENSSRESLGSPSNSNHKRSQTGDALASSMRRGDTPGGDSAQQKMRRAGTMKKTNAESSFEASLASRPAPTLAQQFKIEGIPEDVLEWAMKAFGLFDPTCSGELDPWEIKEALISSGQAAVSDETVFEMIQKIGKVHHAEVRINFKEFAAMCFENFFKPKPDSDDKRDVKEAFVILGGGENGDGEVSVDKLKEFTQSTELTIDIDKLVADVDHDGSGMVDYDEFCQLFEDRLGDTNLHDTGEHWLRNDSVDFGIIPGKRSRPKTPNNLIIDGDAEEGSKVGTPLDRKTVSRPTSQGMTPSHMLSAGGRHSPDVEEFGLRGPAAPRVKKILQSSLPSLERKSLSNIAGGKCRRGWKFNNLRSNIPGYEGYNQYNIKTLNFKDLGDMVKLRTQGAEFTIREHASARLDKRLPSELRLKKVIRDVSRVSSPKGNSPLDLIGVERARLSTRGSSRPETRSDSHLLQRRGRGSTSELMVGASDTSHRAIRKIAQGLVVNVESPQMPNVRPVRSSQNAYRDRPWTLNMKRPVTAPPTEELLKSAASVGLYAGVGVKETGPGISFFDDS